MFKHWQRNRDNKARGLAGTLSGRNVAEQLIEYGTVYGEVLLGMHRELQKARAEIEQQQVNAYANDSELRLLRRELQQLKGEPQKDETAVTRAGGSVDRGARVIATTALLFALLALLFTVVAWTPD
jgi:hypothetical protein